MSLRARTHGCHCERSEAIQGCVWPSGLLRRCAPRNDGKINRKSSPLLSPFAAPGEEEGAEREQQSEESGQQWHLADTRNDAIAILPQPHPAMPGGGPLRSDAADIGDAAWPNPIAAAAGR